MDCGIGNIHDSDPLKVWGLCTVWGFDPQRNRTPQDAEPMQYMGPPNFDKRYCEKPIFPMFC
jgi:hypothetical protein